jgi:hypothetical protein
MFLNFGSIIVFLILAFSYELESLSTNRRDGTYYPWNCKAPIHLTNDLLQQWFHDDQTDELDLSRKCIQTIDSKAFRDYGQKKSININFNIIAELSIINLFQLFSF